MKKVGVYKTYIFGEMTKIKECNIDHLENFANSLNDDQSRILCKYLSYNRKNNVYDFVSKGPDNWKVNNVSISDIYVEKINPAINPYLEKNDWSLKKISKDRNIHQHGEFKSQGHINPKISNFIAKRENHRYIIVDGMHRSIRLACDGKKQFKLIYY